MKGHLFPHYAIELHAVVAMGGGMAEDRFAKRGRGRFMMNKGSSEQVLKGIWKMKVAIISLAQTFAKRGRRDKFTKRRRGGLTRRVPSFEQGLKRI